MNHRKSSIKDAIYVLEIRLHALAIEIKPEVSSNRKRRKLYAEIAAVGRALEVLRREYLYCLDPIEEE